MATITCREVHDLLELSFDRELDPGRMREVALHSATCRQCEEEFRQLQRLREVVARTLSDRVGEIDLSRVWMGIEHRLRPRRRSWVGVGFRWSAPEWGWRIPAFGAAGAAIAAAAIAAFSHSQSPVRETIATTLAGNAASVHETSGDNILVQLSREDPILACIDHELAGDAPVESLPEPTSRDGSD